MSTLFSLVLSRVWFGQLGYFPRPGEVPVAVVEHVRRELGLPEGTTAWCEARNVKAQRQLVRARLGVAHDPQRARAVAEAGIRSAAGVMNHPPDLINVALELLVKASLELPAFSTVDELASRVRREVNTGMFERVAGRIALPDRVGLENLLDVVGPGPTTPYNRLKQPAGKASWSGFREQVEHLRWVDSLDDAGGRSDATVRRKGFMELPGSRCGGGGRYRLSVKPSQARPRVVRGSRFRRVFAAIAQPLEVAERSHVRPDFEPARPP